MAQTTHCPLSLIAEFEATLTKHIKAVVASNPRIASTGGDTANLKYWRIRFYTSDCQLWDWQWAERLQQVREEMEKNRAEVHLRAVLTPSERLARIEICRQSERGRILKPVDASLVDEARKQVVAWRARRRH